MATLTPRQLMVNRLGQLKTERASWMSHWMELSANFSPRQGRYFVTDRNRGSRRYNQIIDDTGMVAVDILSAGLMGGLTSPARPWFKLATADEENNKSHAVKIWMDECTKTMLSIFQRSNMYRALHQVYKELAVFGTSAMIVMADFDNVVHAQTLTIGEYCIATNFQGKADTLYREFQMTIGQIVKEFGRDKCSSNIQQLYDRGQLDSWYTIIHVIEPRLTRDSSKIDTLNMAWKDVYFEQGNTEPQFLRESGHTRFPVMAPRWDVEGGDIYGNSPGMKALGGAKQLQHEQRRKGQAIDYQVNPPLQVPTGMKNKDIDRLPGGITFVDAAGAQAGIRSAFQVDLRLDYLLADIQDVRQRIRACFYADLFLMLSQDNGTMTATEVAARHEEKMLMLGPVLERLQDELLDPLIDTTFDLMIEAGLVPPPPPELEGQTLGVVLVSVLAQAQRAIATNGIDRFVANLGGIAQFKPEVLDKFDSDTWADEYSDMLGVSPRMIVPKEQVDRMRAARAQAQQQAAQQQQANLAADTAQKLGATPTTGGNAASDVMNMFAQ